MGTLVALVSVFALNVALFGPTFSDMPEMSQKTINRRALAEKRTADVLAMAPTAASNANIPRSRGFGSRNLSAEEGGVMEYTRRRHRFLGDYVHVDVSGDFSAFGKWTVSVIYFAYWVFLLFGLMLTTIYLEKMERGGLFDKLRDSLDDPVNWKRSAKIMLMSTIGSAAVMNDSVVLIFSGVVVDLCVRHKVANSLPYLLSLATTANTGSALTLTGNPQNILIVSLMYDDISWIDFAANMLLPVFTASAINAIMMFVYYGAELFPGSSGIMENAGIMFLGNRTPEMLAQEHAYYARQAATEGEVEDEGNGWTFWSKLQVVIIVCFLFFFAFGFGVCVVSITTGAILMVIAAYKRQHYDPKPDNTQYDVEGNPLPAKKTYDMDGNEIEPEEEELVTESETTLTEVDYGLLMLFIGQFLLIGSFDDTGVPQSFFAATMGGCAEQMTSVPCVYWFVMIVTILSNVASNVPVCQMLAATFPYATPYDWMQVSFSATIAGNLTMLGSAANMIVAFQAAKVGDRTFTSERHAPFGIPSTILSLYAGTFLLATFHFAPECSERLGDCDDAAE